jgi:hypothetical protein
MADIDNAMQANVVARKAEGAGPYLQQFCFQANRLRHVKVEVASYFEVLRHADRDRPGIETGLNNPLVAGGIGGRRMGANGQTGGAVDKQVDLSAVLYCRIHGIQDESAQELGIPVGKQALRIVGMVEQRGTLVFCFSGKQGQLSRRGMVSRVGA